jgi:hemoglobin
MREAKTPLNCASPSEREARRVQYAAGVTDDTGIDEAMIALQVRRFYAAARCDPLLGPIFARVTDWESHLARITDFWSSVLLMSGRYHGNPLEGHRPLPIGEAHFARWLMLWRATAAETFPPPAAARFALLAERIAASLSRALGIVQPGERS